VGRVVRTQIEELFALYRLYPLPEFESASAYSDAEPYNHPLFAEADREAPVVLSHDSQRELVSNEMGNPPLWRARPVQTSTTCPHLTG